MSVFCSFVALFFESALKFNPVNLVHKEYQLNRKYDIGSNTICQYCLSKDVPRTEIILLFEELLYN